MGDKDFLGGAEYTIDEKSRLTVPQMYRYDLGKEFIVTKGLGGCLFVLTQDVWDRSFYQKYKDQPTLDLNTIKVQRFFFGEATKTSVDTQGRIPLPQTLRDYAGLEPGKPVIVVGVLNRLEIWNKERWKKVNEDLTEDVLLAAVDAIEARSKPEPNA